MITRPTTLILGAGASAHLGYPLARGLLNDIIVEIEKATITPEMAIIRCHKHWMDLRDGLKRGGWESPDAFLEHNPASIPLGKKVIAYCLKRYENSDGLFPPNDNGWYGRLAQSLLTESVDSFRKNRLSIVTFNYDRTIEHYLHLLVQYRYNLSFMDAWQLVKETIPIVHVHGMLGTYPSISYGNHGDIDEMAKEIKVIHEFSDMDDKFCSAEFEYANELLNNSEVIFSIGFSMASQNMSRLRFFNEEEVKRRTVMCAIGSVHGRDRSQMVERLSSFGLTTNHLISTDSASFFVHHGGFQ